MKTLKDVPFASEELEDGNTNFYLDLYLPSQPSDEEHEVKEFCQRRENVASVRKRKQYPVVLFVHGGGWRRGGRQAWRHFLYTEVNLLATLIIWFVNTYSNVGEAFADNDVACAVISYPLTDLKIPYVFAELVTCYVGCCLPLLLVLTPAIIVTSLYVPMVHGTHFTSWIHFWHEVDHSDHTVATVLGFLVLVNLMILTLFSFKRTRFNLSSLQLAFMWTIVLTSYVLTRHISFRDQLFTSFFTTLVITQGHILRGRLSHSNTTHVNQANVVAKAVKWIKDFADSSGTVDGGRIILMGHSAGGHLVSLVTLDDQFLTKVGCSTKDIKGVISLSGVYDLFCLDHPVLKRFYLFPPFGHNRNHWPAASPAHVLEDRPETTSLPPFLLMCAQQDLMLRDQSFRFADQLLSRDIKCTHVQMPGTNHFTIVTSLWKTYKEQSILERCVNFVLML